MEEGLRREEHAGAADLAKGNHKAGRIQGQTRQHSRLINLLGVKQIAIGVNKMDCDTAAYKQARLNVGPPEPWRIRRFFWHCLTAPSLLARVWMGDDAVVTSASLPTCLSVSVNFRDTWPKWT